MLTRYLPLIAGVLPLAAVYLAFGIGVYADALPACVPLIDGCVSVSATGRKPPGSFLFRAVMLPQVAFLLLTWYVAVDWLRSLDANLSRHLSRAIHVSSLVSALALVLYVTFLGTKEPLYEFMRRFGIYFFFIGMVLTEVFVVIALSKMTHVMRHGLLRRQVRTMTALSALPFALGLLNFYLKATLEDPDAAENSIEWIAATSMQLYLVVMYFAWKASGFRTQVETSLRP